MMNNSTSKTADLPIISFICSTDFENWLELNHNNSNGIWLQFYKKNSGTTSINYKEALDVALCYGWIDGQLKKMDENSYLQRFTHRRPKSLWSIRNIENVDRLVEIGRMKPTGLKEAEAAKADGRWDRAYETAGRMILPDDFMQELSTNTKAQTFFDSLNRTNKYTIYWRLQTAKNTEIRVKRMKAILDMLEKGQKFH